MNIVTSRLSNNAEAKREKNWAMYWLIKIRRIKVYAIFYLLNSGGRIFFMLRAVSFADCSGDNDTKQKEEKKKKRFLQQFLRRNITKHT